MNPSENPQKVHCLMSLRCENVFEMFDTRRKQYEFRTWFPSNYKGLVYIYESGPNSRHSVVGFFEARCVITMTGGKPWPDLLHKFVDKTCPWSLEELNDVSESLEPGKRIFTIPVFAPRQFRNPYPLKVFNEVFKAQYAEGYHNPKDTDINRPPLSWRLITLQNGDGSQYALPPNRRRKADE